MAVLAVDNLPAFGVGLGGAAPLAPAGGGDSFVSTGNEILLVLGTAGWTTETVQVEGVPAQDSARDGTSTLNPGSVGGLDAAGPFKPRNFSNSGSVDLTYPGGVTGLQLFILRFTTG